MKAARREVDAGDSAKMPRAKLEPIFLNIGNITGDIKRDIILTNTGKVCKEYLQCIHPAARLQSLSLSVEFKIVWYCPCPL